MHYMKWIYPRRLRNQMILMAILMVIVPTLTIGYIVETEGRSAVLSEKEKKLSAVVNLLNQALGNRYDLYIDLPREERIRALNAELAPITENITHAFPGIGAGYYNKTLDAIITYAPSALYQNNVGVTIAADRCYSSRNNRSRQTAVQTQAHPPAFLVHAGKAHRSLPISDFRRCTSALSSHQRCVE